MFYKTNSTILKGKFNIKSSELNQTLIKIQSENYILEKILKLIFNAILL